MLLLVCIKRFNSRISFHVYLKDFVIFKNLIYSNFLCYKAEIV